MSIRHISKQPISEMWIDRDKVYESNTNNVAWETFS